jgi:cytochrome c-type biogenesis protein CcmH
MKYLWLVLSLLLAAPASSSSIDAYPFEDPGQEKIYKKLIEELRCLVCQNQNLAASNAELAQDMRRKTYDLALAGKSEQEIVDYMVQRYGEFVLYKPPLQANTLLLWIGPFIIFLIAVAVLIRFIRRKPDVDASALSDADKVRAATLLNNNEGEK